MMNSLKRQLFHTSNKSLLLLSSQVVQHHPTSSSTVVTSSVATRAARTQCRYLHKYTTPSLFESSSSSKTDTTTTTSTTSLNQCTPYSICFIRHGQSTWNRDNRFIGWTDTPLTDDGVLEARVAGQMLVNANIKFDEVHTSLLRRSIRTTNIVLMEIQQEYIPVHKHYRLNERNYGDLVGLNKKETVERYGKEQVKRWRRSYDEPPPPMSQNHPYHPKNDPRYRHMLEHIPASESLKCTLKRSSVYWDEVIAPAIRSGKTLLIVGHENNLRALLMKLENISPQDIIHLNIPRAVPLAYKLDPITLQPINLREDGQFDEATGYLRGTWLGGDHVVKNILDRDDKQVYDTSIKENLEIGPTRNNWKTWTEFILGKPSPDTLIQAYDKSTTTTSSSSSSIHMNQKNINGHTPIPKHHNQEQARAA